MIDTTDPIFRAFLQEGAEQVETLSELFLRLESQPGDAELLAQIMRTAHNLKGGAGTARQNGIASVAHKVEEVIQRVRSGSLSASPALFDLLLKTMDVLGASIEEIAGGHGEPMILGAALSDLEQYLAARHSAREVEGSAPTSKWGFALGEYDHIRIRVLQQRGRRLWRADVSVAKEHDAPVEWAQRTLRALRRSCDIIATVPADVDLHTVETSRRLAILLGTELSREALLDLLAAEGPETSSVRDPDEPDESAEPQAAPAMPERVQPKAQAAAIKVDLTRVDALVDMIGELVIVQSMVANAPEIASLTSRKVQNYLSHLTRITRDLQDAGLRLRMVPLRTVFQVMARTVRDLGRKHGKHVVLATHGDDVEMDRSVVELLRDPLVHLVRNSVDHGIEPPEERVRVGKPATATITLSAYHQGGSIVVEVKDDGRGLDRQKILEKAKSVGLVREGATLTETETWNLIFEGGFSTAERVTDTSGRGVGLDIVRRNLESMRGRVNVSSKLGRGTSIRMVVPLTLAIIDGMLIRSGSERYILPTISIIESLRPKESSVLSLTGRWKLLNLRGAMLPLVPLGDLLDVPGERTPIEEGLVVVVEGAGRKVGLIVDEVIAQQQVVIKSVGSGLESARFISGAAILPDGSVGLILSIDEIASAGASAAEASKHSEVAHGTA